MTSNREMPLFKPPRLRPRPADRKAGPMGPCRPERLPLPRLSPDQITQLNALLADLGAAPCETEC